MGKGKNEAVPAREDAHVNKMSKCKLRKPKLVNPNRVNATKQNKISKCKLSKKVKNDVILRENLGAQVEGYPFRVPRRRSLRACANWKDLDNADADNARMRQEIEINDFILTDVPLDQPSPSSLQTTQDVEYANDDVLEEPSQPAAEGPSDKAAVVDLRDVKLSLAVS